MNVQTPLPQRAPVKLNVGDFLMLRGAGAFAQFLKAELIEGELRGMPRVPDNQEQSDVTIPIKLKSADYALLSRYGTLSDNRKTELIDGLVYAVSPQHRRHGFVKDELAYRLRRALEALDSRWSVATEQSVALGPYSEPQPDIILTDEPRGEDAIPGASVQLLVEVSVNTAGFDLGEKARLYAAAGIAEYWVVDVNVRVIHQMWRSEDGIYAERREVLFGASITAVTIAGLTIDTVGL